MNARTGAAALRLLADRLPELETKPPILMAGMKIALLYPEYARAIVDEIERRQRENDDAEYAEMVSAVPLGFHVELPVDRLRAIRDGKVSVSRETAATALSLIDEADKGFPNAAEELRAIQELRTVLAGFTVAKKGE